MIILLVILTVLILVLFLVSRSRYDTFIDPLNASEYRLKILIPVGLFIMDALRYKYRTSYDRRMLSILAELAGAKNAHFLLKIHWGNKLILALISLQFAVFIGAVSKADMSFAIFALCLVGGTIYLTDRELSERVKRRRLAIRADFPDFVNRLTLLINAGMTVTRAWERIALSSNNGSPLYIEINLTVQEIMSGLPEQKAYEEFAKRCRTTEITRFISVILQNLRKGNSELIPVLRVFANECWEMRKNTARKYGEEASTRMLLPMMIMFLAILIIAGLPAVLALNGV